jgi:hypothetical protein
MWAFFTGGKTDGPKAQGCAIEPASVLMGSGNKSQPCRHMIQLFPQDENTLGPTLVILFTDARKKKKKWCSNISLVLSVRG